MENSEMVIFLPAKLTRLISPIVNAVYGTMLEEKRDFSAST